MAYGISNSISSNMTTNVEDAYVYSMNTDGANGSEEYTWQNQRWSQYWGYFNDQDLGELKSAFLMKSTWNVGKGYECDTETKVILDHISGMGKDTFTDILFNMDLLSRLGGDAFAEIIRDDNKTLLNLKVLDPGSIKIVLDNKGIIKRYEQTNKVSGGIIKFKPEEIFHLSHNRFADSIHGLSDIISMENTILAEKESFKDMKRIMHRQAKPMIMFKLGTDDPTKIQSFVTKMDEAVNRGENIYIPDDKNTVSYEVIQININTILMQWRDNIRDKFYRTLGLPLIVFGSSGTTESGGKIEYLAHEQVFSHDQRFLEEQVWNQLYLKIKLNSPVTLLENLQQDQAKDGNQGLEMQKNDITAGSGA